MSNTAPIDEHEQNLINNGIALERAWNKIMNKKPQASESSILNNINEVKE